MHKSTKITAVEVLSDIGPIAKFLPGFNQRKEQQQMAEEITAAINEKLVLVCEAGTGTGKTLGYLTPIFLSERRAIISTATKALQSQLYHRDIPVIKNALDSSKTVSLLKGRQNYLCVHRMNESVGDRRINVQNLKLLVRVQKWAKQTSVGDLEELEILKDNSEIKPFITSTTDNCLGAECPAYTDCHVVNARRQAAASDVVVVNHHLLFADMALKESGFAELLPTADIVVLDEAHKVPDIASLFFSQSISARQISIFCQDCRTAVQKEAPDMLELVTGLEQLEQKQSIMRGHMKQQTARFTWGSQKNNTLINGVVQELAEILNAIILQMQIAEERGTELSACYSRAIILRDKWSLFESEPMPDHIHWIEISNRNFTLFDTPVTVAKEFSNLIDKSSSFWLMTSATLTVNGEFDYFKRNLGIESARECLLESPFDYKKQALLYLPELTVPPNNIDFEKHLVDAALPVLEASAGHAFFLFTSFKSLNATAMIMSARSDYPLLVQGERPRNELLKRFQNTPNAVLLGTSTFWEGIDVRGQQLSVVIIDKLPFSPPADPIINAQITRLLERGENPFEQLQIPQAATILKQGAGRLIRDATDRGVLMIGDNRLQTRTYGELFINSLPPMRITTDIEDVQIFFDS